MVYERKPVKRAVRKLVTMQQKRSAVLGERDWKNGRPLGKMIVAEVCGR